MKQKKWIKKFETINGRKPSPLELYQAEENGQVDKKVNKGRKGKTLKYVLSAIFLLLILIGGAVFFFNQFFAPRVDEDNFKTGVWVTRPIYTQYETKDQEEFFNKYHSDSDFYSESREDTDWSGVEFKPLKNYDEGSEFGKLSIDEIKDIIQEITGKEAREQDFRVIEHWHEDVSGNGITNTDTSFTRIDPQYEVAYWIDKNTVITLLQYQYQKENEDETTELYEFHINRKVTPKKGFSGTYKITDAQAVGEPHLHAKYKEQVENMKEERVIRTFDGLTSPDSEMDGKQLMSYDDFVTFYKLSGDDMEDIKSLDDIASKIKQLGYKVDLQNIYVLFDTKEYEQYGARNKLDTVQLMISVEGGNKILMTPLLPSRSDYLDTDDDEERIIFDSLIITWNKINLDN